MPRMRVHLFLTRSTPPFWWALPLGCLGKNGPQCHELWFRNGMAVLAGFSASQLEPEQWTKPFKALNSNEYPAKYTNNTNSVASICMTFLREIAFLKGASFTIGYTSVFKKTFPRMQTGPRSYRITKEETGIRCGCKMGRVGSVSEQTILFPLHRDRR
jgi:hypothetical protein